MAEDVSHLDANRRERERLTRLVVRLDADELARPLGDGWTAAAALAHLAFWDRFVLARWRQRLRADGPFVALDDGLLDLVNAAGLPQWLALPPVEAARQAVAAADELDLAIAGLAPALVAEVRGLGLTRMLDRFEHRRVHLDEVERALPK